MATVIAITVREVTGPRRPNLDHRWFIQPVADVCNHSRRAPGKITHAAAAKGHLPPTVRGPRREYETVAL